MRSKYLDYDGTDQTVIIIDSGWANGYSVGNLAYQWDFAENDSSAWNWDSKTHGAMVGSVVLDYADDVNIIHLKVFDDGPGGGASFLDVERALQWAVQNAGYFNTASVNISLGAGRTYFETTTSLSNEITALYNMGIMTTVAAGNSGGYGVNVISASPNAVGVGSVDAYGNLSYFSQTHSSLVDLYALGENVPVVDVNGNTDFISGTSFAAPVVSASYAALKEASLSITNSTVTIDQFLDMAISSGRNVNGSSNNYIISTDDLISHFVEIQDSKGDGTGGTISFDESYYLSNNPDVLLAVASGLLESAKQHYDVHGFQEGRDPSSSFDSSFYLESNPDVRAAGINPLDHYNSFGRFEGRIPMADVSSDDGDETPVIPPTDPQSPWAESAPTVFARIYSPNGGSYDFRAGGWSNDVIVGTSQNEYFDINYGFDTLTGGGGSDVFAFNSVTDNDTITDFDPRNDFLDLGYWATTTSTTIHETGTGSSVIQIIDTRSTITLTGVTVDEWSLIRDADHGAIFG